MTHPGGGVAELGMNKMGNQVIRFKRERYCVNQRSTIIFDFDGTLHDSMYIYRIALTRGYQWLIDAGKAEPRELSDADMAANIGLTVQEAWARMCPDVPWDVTKDAAKIVGDTMHALIADGTARLYPGVPEMLQQLKDAGHELVFLSNCRTVYLEVSRQAFDLDRWFSGYYAAEQYDDIPKEEIFEIIRKEFAGPYIAVGDRYKDLALARAHDLASIGCLYGCGSREELAGATYLAESPADIPGLVARIDGYSSASAPFAG